MQNNQLKNTVKNLLGVMLLTTGTSHLTVARKEFKAQVPNWVPLKKDDTVVYSGIAELALGAALLLSGKHTAPLTGKAAAAFFTAVFPGNIAQYKHRRDAFGLDTDAKRFARLFMQPVLIGLALYAGSKRSRR